MTRLDWLVLTGTIVAIVAWGLWKTRAIKTSETYLRGGDQPWWTIGLSIMATQASAITFLSMPGQAFTDGMGFIQFYFGQPIAMVLLAAFIVPIYCRLKIYTAYEYLETRFDRRTRQATAFLFLIARGLAAGISIYAPAIVLSTVMGWSLAVTNLVIGLLVILYTVSGGTRAVSATQSWQMAVMLGGMVVAFFVVVHALPANITVGKAFDLADVMGRMHIVDFSLRPGARYTLWSGLFGGLFVGLAYFGTDQSQVQRYLSSSIRESRLGLLFNGLVKVPMQFLILSVGVMVFVFYAFSMPPVSFQRPSEKSAAYEAAYAERRAAVDDYLAATDTSRSAARAHLEAATQKTDALRKEARDHFAKANIGASANDADYVFIRFVIDHFPSGLVGLLFAVIFCAAMSATASALNALGTTTVVDFYRPTLRPHATDHHYFRAAQLFTVGWGLVAMAFATFASLVDNLIQAVNILGSIFYGPTLGVFIMGFFCKSVGPRAIFWALIVGQAIVIAVFATSSIGFLWYNVIGALSVVLLSLATRRLDPGYAASSASTNAP